MKISRARRNEYRFRHLKKDVSAIMHRAQRGLDTSIETQAAGMRLQAATGIFDGTELTASYLNRCRALHFPTGTELVFSRDAGMHSSGWWKNPDYERCLHLSLSFFGIKNGKAYKLPRCAKLSEQWIKEFFGEDRNLIWIEPPHSDYGKTRDIWHYRLFCDENWYPIKPRGEVYSRENTPAGWLSYSDLMHEQEKKDQDG